MSWVTNNEWLQDKTKEPIYWNELRRFAELYRPQLPKILAVALVASAGASIYFAIPYVFMGAQDSLRAHNVKHLLLLMTAYGVILCMQTSATYITKKLQGSISMALNREITLSYYQKLLNISVADFLAFKNRTNLFQRLIDALAVTAQATEVLTQSLQAIITLAITLSIISHISTIVSLIVLFGQGVLFAFVVSRSYGLRRQRQRLLAANYPLVSKMLEIIEGLLTIKTLTATVRVSSDVDSLISAKCEAEYKEAVYDVSVSQGATLIGHLINLSSLTFAFTSASKGTLTFGQALALYVLVTLALNPTMDLGRLFQNLASLSGNVKNYYEIVNLEDETSTSAIGTNRDPETSVSKGSETLTSSYIGDGLKRSFSHRIANGKGSISRSAVLDEQPPASDPTPQLPSLRITFDDITFGYKDRDPVLEKFSLSVAPGERVCLVGRSGAGKTTILRLLLGFLKPQEGTISVGGINIADFEDKNCYRRMFGVVSQDDMLFNVSLRENLSFGLAELPSNEVIRSVLQHVNLLDELEAGKRTLDTIYEAHAFSGGQKQRLIIARSLLRQPRIVLLDEPTSALDFESEGKVIRSLDLLGANRTTISVAHRLSTVRSATRIVVVGDKKVLATGSHDELMVQSQYYRDLCQYNSFIL